MEGQVVQDKWFWTPKWYFFASLTVFAFLILITKFVWFPSPFDSVLGYWKLVGWMFLVNIITGGFIYSILYKPSKSKIAKISDLMLVIFLQITAGGYGIFAMSSTRPLALVYEFDRFRLIVFADIPSKDLDGSPEWVKRFGSWHNKVLGIGRVNTLEEKMASVASSLQGVEPSQRPARWIDINENRDEIILRSKKINDLILKNPILKNRIISDFEDIAKKFNITSVDNLIWLPLVSRHGGDFIAIFDRDRLDFLSVLELDGFI
ncbi:MAG: hypothetical protein WBF95_08740 [Comamonas thiooxydans]